MNLRAVDPPRRAIPILRPSDRIGQPVSRSIREIAGVVESNLPTK